MPRIEIRRQTVNDHAAVIALWNRISSDSPPPAFESLEAESAPSAHRVHSMRFVALKDDTLVGALSLEEVTWLANPNIFFVRLGVNPDHCKQGVGLRLVEMLDRIAADVGAASLYVKVGEGDEDSRRFASIRGFAPTGDVDRPSRLDLSRFTPSTEFAARRARLDDDGIQLVPLRSVRMDESFLHHLHELTEDTTADIPSVEPALRESFDVWRSRFLERRGLSLESTWVAIAGDVPVGVAYLRRYSRNVAKNVFTGVARTHRGMGVAHALKTAQIVWACDAGLCFLYTENDDANAAIIAVNTGLGYEFLPSQIELGKRLRD